MAASHTEDANEHERTARLFGHRHSKTAVLVEKRNPDQIDGSPQLQREIAEEPGVRCLRLILTTSVAESHGEDKLSSLPKPASRLLASPAEIRLRIYELLLIKSDWIFVAFDTVYNIVSQYRELKRDTLGWLAVGARGTISILLACKKTYLEAITVLYSQNKFMTYNVSGFRDVFINHPSSGIGCINAAHIRTASFDVPDLVKYKPKENMDGFIDFISTKLPHLQCLSLNTKFFDMMHHPIKSCSRAGQDEVRGLLNAAAFMTKTHPVLRKAYWQNVSRDHASTQRELVVRWSVELRPVGRSNCKRTTNSAGAGIHKTKSVLLDC